jgi:hypothetical protein
VPYFLDGNNLIGRERKTGRPTDDDADALVREVADRLRGARARAVIFFDGPSGRRPATLGSLSVRYPSSGSADSEILATLARSGSPAEVVVVTADRELARRARDNGARWMAPEDFWKRFGANRREGTAGREDSRVDVEEWMRYFGVRDEEEK